MSHTVKRIEAHLLVQDLKLAIVVTRWNHFIVDRLLEGAITAYQQHGGHLEQLEVYTAPGAFEVPLVAKKLAKTGRFDAVVCLGAVIKGSTDHYDFVAGSATSGIAGVSLDTEIPVMFGILTTDSIEQAIERAGTKAGNKGAEAVLAAIETVNLLRQIG